MQEDRWLLDPLLPLLTIGNSVHVHKMRRITKADALIPVCVTEKGGVGRHRARKKNISCRDTKAAATLVALHDDLCVHPAV